MAKQSSPALSTLAAKYVRMTDAGFYKHFVTLEPGPSKRLFRDIRKLAASVLSQDQTKGQGK